MPPRKDNSDKDPNTAAKKPPRKNNKTRKKKEGPSKTRKTDRVVLNSQARDIIAKVYEFMKSEGRNARSRTAKAVGVSEKTVTRIVKERMKPDPWPDYAGGTAAVGQVLAGKIHAVNDMGLAVGEAANGNITGVLQNMESAINSVATGDVNGVLTAGATVGSVLGGTPSILGSGSSHLGGSANLTATVGSVLGGTPSILGGGSSHLGGSANLTGSIGNLTHSILGTGLRAAETVLAGKLGAIGEISGAVNAATRGNITGAEGRVSGAVNQVVSHDVAAANILSNGAGGSFRHSIFDY